VVRVSINYFQTSKEVKMTVHQCTGITCMFPGCLNNPHNNVQFRHRNGLPKRMTLGEFRKKYGTNGVSSILDYLIEHIPLSASALKDFKQLSADIQSLLQEE
jgi:hypothetical protein